MRVRKWYRFGARMEFMAVKSRDSVVDEIAVNFVGRLTEVAPNPGPLIWR